MKRIFRTAALLLAALIGGAVFSAAALEKRYEGVYRDTVRLHVLAASDDEEDQKVKLLLRDELLAFLQPVLKNALSKEDAQQLLEKSLPDIRRKAENCLSAAGKPADVNVTLSEEYYPTRHYEGLSYPAGKYLSLRVFIGKGEGKNWWCVVWPPLCLSASSAGDGGYSEDEQSLLKREDKRYEVRFFFLDLLGRVKKLFS